MPGAIPLSSASNEAPASVNTGALLDSILGQTAESQRLMRQAITPVEGGRVGQIPSSLTHPKGPAPQSQGYAQPKNKGQAIANMITDAGNTVSQIITKVKQQKQDHLVDATTKLFQAHTLKDEAQQQYDSAKSMSEGATGEEAKGYLDTMEKAKKTMDDNDKAIHSIVDDPKMRKDLAKVLHVNHVDFSENRPEDIAALKKATENVKGWKDKREAAKAEQQKQNEAAAGRFAEAFPKTMPRAPGAPNVLAQQQLAAHQQQRKDAIETYKAMGPIHAAQLKAQGAITVENMRSATDLRKAAIESAEKLDTQILKNTQADKDNAAARSLANLSAANARSLELLKQGNPTEVLKSFNDAQKSYTTSTTETQRNRQALNLELDKADSSRAIEIRRQLQSLDATDEQAKNAFTLNRNVIAKGLGMDVNDSRLQIPTVHVGEGAQNGAGAAGTSAKPISTDNDPRTGKPWKPSVSATDRLLIKGHYGAGILSHSVEQAVESVNSEFNKLKKWATTDQDPD